MAILMRAADLWAEGKHGGHPSDDADLIIAATALETGRVLVTGNTAHCRVVANKQANIFVRQATIQSHRMPQPYLIHRGT
jgi:predicted nucleic acid-binding protein